MPDQRDTTCRPSLTACPISLGRVTRMSEGAFRSLCERYQRQQRDQRRQPTGGSLIYGRCATCKGRHLPDELSIIDKGEIMAMAKKKASQAEALGDAAVLNALEKELGCGPGEDVLTRARLMKEELDKAKAAGAFREEAKDMRSTLGLPGDADWAAIAGEVARVRALVDQYGELKQEYDKLASEKADVDDALLRAQKALSDTELDEKARRKSMVSDIGMALGKDEQDWDWDELVVDVTGMKRELREVQRLLDDREARLIKAEATAEELEGRLEEVRATLAEIERIVDPDGNNSLMLTEQIEDLVMRRIPTPEPNTDALTDFARRVLRGEVSLMYHERQ